MATVPTIDFRAEDVIEGGQVSPSKVVDALNRMARLQREALTHGITAENLRVQDVELTLQTGAAVADSFPLAAISLEKHMPAKPTTVRVLQRRNLTTPTSTFTTASDVDWQATGDRQVSVRYIPGLAVSTKYLLTLRIEG